MTAHEKLMAVPSSSLTCAHKHIYSIPGVFFFFPSKNFPLYAIHNEAPSHPGLGLNKQLCLAGGVCTLWEANTTDDTPYSVSIRDLAK